MNTGEFIATYQKANVKELALLAHKYPLVDINFAIDQISGLQIASQKLPTFSAIPDIHYPHHLSLEQCSSEFTANYKARLIARHSSPTELNSFADLTAGFGVDCAVLSRLFKKAAYVEQQAYLCELARHNFFLLNLSHITVQNTNSLHYLEQMEKVDWIFLDPARRSQSGKKVVAISDCEPDVSSFEELLLEKATHVLIKLSPMLDISLAVRTLKHVCEVHIVSVNNECKELLFLLSRELSPLKNLNIITYNLQKEEQIYSSSISHEKKATAIYTNTLETYLYEPNTSVTKSGLLKGLCQAFGIKKLHPNSHLYTSSKLVENFPGRIFQVEHVYGFSKKETKTLQMLKQANLSTRNFPQTVNDLRKRLKLTDGGCHYLFATTLQNGEKVIVDCLKP